MDIVDDPYSIQLTHSRIIFSLLIYYYFHSNLYVEVHRMVSVLSPISSTLPGTKTAHNTTTKQGLLLLFSRLKCWMWMTGNGSVLEGLHGRWAIIPFALVFFMALTCIRWFRICPSNQNVSSQRLTVIFSYLVHHGVSSTLNSAWHLVTSQSMCWVTERMSHGYS